jgi:two-component system phosphate regulon sensor histidine kinase PhoR
MVLTITVTLYVAIIVVVAVLLAIGFMLMKFRKRQKLDKSLSVQLDDLKNKTELMNSQKRETTPVEESYLQFIYNVSHEVSNPLQSVQTNLENMADWSPEEVGRWNQYYKIIGQEIKRLFTLTENLRTLSHLESVERSIKREPVNLKSVVEDVIMAQVERASARNITLEYQGPNRPAKVLGDRGRLFQMVINLVDNSIKYSKDTEGKVILGVKENNEFTQLSVNDDGIGVPEEDLPYIFDTAYRSPSKHSIRKAGSGLGLAIVKRIAEQHSGKINVESVVGEGTTITVALPLYTPSDQE